MMKLHQSTRTNGSVDRPVDRCSGCALGAAARYLMGRACVVLNMKYFKDGLDN